MTIPTEHPDLSAETAPADVSLLPDQARAAVEEIRADNAALEEADQAAEAQAEVVAEQARQMAEATEEALEELKEGANPHS
jgi:hypothetical protein